MEIHRFETVWLGASLLLIVAWIATVTYGAVGVGVTMIDDSGGTIDPSNLNAHPKFSEPGVYKVGDNRYAVYIVAQQFSFIPGSTNPIQVPAGSTVTFHVTSADVVHGFEVVGTNINSMVIPGQISEFTVEFDDPETYDIRCNEYCGAGHHNMIGTIEVVPADQFNASTQVVNQ
ncbi:MAG: cytochrome c oxidase subunit II [Halobacteriaceae archaeon]